ncbi:MAG: invasion associated locus B family protein [Alphaproteobacteria bacterium]
MMANAGLARERAVGYVAGMLFGSRQLCRAFFLGALLVLVAGVAAPLPAIAQDSRLLGKFGDWAAYVRGDGKSKYCYIVSAPQEASLGSRRGDIFALVWHRPGDKQFDVVQTDIGYVFKEGEAVAVDVDGKKWSMFTREGTAWSLDQDQAAIVEAMRKGKRMTIKGVSNRGNPTTDIYSLSGVTAAHNAINKACPR